MKVQKFPFEARIGSMGLIVTVKLDVDAPGLLVFNISRHGINECLVDPTELRLLGEALRIAGLDAIEREAA